MKKILFTALMCCALPAAAQTEIAPYKPGVNAEGVTYFLPRTALRVDLLVEVKRYTPGEYAKYAERYLRVKDVAIEPSETWTIKEIHMDVFGKPDTTKVYTLKLKDKTIAPMVKLSDDGMLLAINAEPQPTTPFEGYTTEKGGRKLDSRQFMTEEILMAGSNAKTAQLCAQEIYSIRESKNLLNRGQADYMPTDGKQMEIMINNLNEQEEALAQLFLGYTLSETKTYTFYIDPTSDMDKQVLFRFSRHLGVVDADDLSGAPVYITIKDQHTVPAPEENPDARKKSARLDGIQYNVPSKAKVEIFTDQQPLVNAEVAFGQFGNVETLSSVLFNKRTETKVVFYDQTGGVKSIDE
jgi:hypothetical protein